MAKHNNTGKEGELLAQKHLQSLGYEILHTNWVCNKNELDIVATKDNLLVIVEVKSRSSLRFDNPKMPLLMQKSNVLFKQQTTTFSSSNLTKKCAST